LKEHLHITLLSPTKNYCVARRNICFRAAVPCCAFLTGSLRSSTGSFTLEDLSGLEVSEVACHILSAWKPDLVRSDFLVVPSYAVLSDPFHTGFMRYHITVASVIGLIQPILW